MSSRANRGFIQQKPRLRAETGAAGGRSKRYASTRRSRIRLPFLPNRPACCRSAPRYQGPRGAGEAAMAARNNNPSKPFAKQSIGYARVRGVANAGESGHTHIRIRRHHVGISWKTTALGIAAACKRKSDGKGRLHQRYAASHRASWVGR
jgi:hypothetical protein